MLGQAASELDLGDIKELDLLELLKSYYRLCRQSTATDRQTLLKDPAFIRILCALLTDQRQNISVYICKILLLVTDQPAEAKYLGEKQEFTNQLDKALSLDNDQIQMPPRIIRKLLIVKSRISRATSSTKSCDAKPIPEKKKTIFGNSTQGSKQIIFTFERPSEAQLREIEQKCIKTPGVVSICFQQIQLDETRCLIRCRGNIEDQALVRLLLSVKDLEMIKQLVRNEDGQMETFEYYASELSERDIGVHKNNQLPNYLEDDLVFDPAQSIATKEQVEATGRDDGWFSSLKSMFW